MEWLTVLSLIFIGLAILLVEIIFVPGSTIVGLIGLVLMVIGVALSFRYFGLPLGWATTGGTAAVTGLVIYFAFKANVWGVFTLKTSINSKVNEGEAEGLLPGAEGITLSALRPVGRAEVDKKTYEVRTMGNYLESGTKIRVLQIQDNQIIVEPLT